MRGRNFILDPGVLSIDARGGMPCPEGRSGNRPVSALPASAIGQPVKGGNEGPVLTGDYKPINWRTYLTGGLP